MNIDFHFGRRTTPKMQVYRECGCIHISLGMMYLELCVMGNDTQHNHHETAIPLSATAAEKG